MKNKPQIYELFLLEFFKKLKIEEGEIKARRIRIDILTKINVAQRRKNKEQFNNEDFIDIIEEIEKDFDLDYFQDDFTYFFNAGKYKRKD